MLHIRLFIGILLFSLPGALYAQKKTEEKQITLDEEKVPVTKIMQKIEEQTGMFFSYESSIVEDMTPVTIKVSGESLENCLKLLFEKRPVMYQISGRTIILKKKPRQVVISGFVRDSESSESLIGASVYDLHTRRGTASNSYGFFSVSLDPGDIELRVSYIGYQPQVLSFPFMEKDTMITINLAGNAMVQEIVVLSSDKERQQHLTTQMGALEINQQTIRNTPVLLGEADIIKTLQLTPGVATGVEGLAGMYVRGGNMDENLFLIDGNPVYQVNHLGGIFSAFNPEVIRGMDFFKAGFPARYGGRLSSVVDVHTKEGNMKEFHGSASIGLIAANLNLEGPIVKDRTSFVISLRRTWLDAILKPMLAIQNKSMKEDGEKYNANYFFHDLNIKLNHRFSDRSRMYLSLYNGKDKLDAESKTFDAPNYSREINTDFRSRLEWGNLMATAGWTYVYTPKLFGRVSAFYTRYRSSMEQENKYEVLGNRYSELDLNSFAQNITGISDFGFRSSFDYMPSTSHRVRFGGDAVLHRFRPEYSQVNVNGKQSDLGTTFTDELFWAREFGVYIEDDWTLSPALRVNAGLRYSLFHVNGKLYRGLEPRLSIRWLLRDELSLKASYARMNQYVHVLATSYINLPTDAWMPVTNKLKPLICDQLSAGLYYNLNNTFDFSLEGYYKRFTNLLDYKDGHSFLPSFTPWDEKLANGTGRGYGMELMARKQTGKTTGWVGYTLSWSDRKFKEIDEGERFPSRFDNRHKLNMVVMHKLTSKIELSAAWTYSSGNRTTLSLEGYETFMPGSDMFDHITLPAPVDYYGRRNNYKLPDYHRLDLGINFYRPKKNGRMGIWNVSIYNAYSRMNPFMIYRDTESTYYQPESNTNAQQEKNDIRHTVKYKQVSILPIIPSISYTYRF